MRKDIIFDLRNYAEVLKEVDITSRVYLTRNGHGEYEILAMEEIDELDRYKAASLVLTSGEIIFILTNKRLLKRHV